MTQTARAVPLMPVLALALSVACTRAPTHTADAGAGGQDNTAGSGGGNGSSTKDAAGPHDAATDLPEPAEYRLHSFDKLVLSTEFRAEGAAFGDLNRDGKTDIVAGPFWYEGPSFKMRRPFTTGPIFDAETGYSDNFFAYVDDLDDDTWLDIIIIGFPGRETFWYRNPGPPVDAVWTRHLILVRTDNEAPTYGDLDGDGQRELICVFDKTYGYAKPVPGDPMAAWRWHSISAQGAWAAFTHGMGVGDIDGDKRPDVIEKDGWWQQPVSLAGDPVWQRHDFRFADLGGAQMFATDLDGDGDNDVVTSLAAHEYGLAWFEQIRGAGAGSPITFRKHLILGGQEGDNPYGVRIPELHAVAIADVDGDGVHDILTGKRFWSHGPNGDPDPRSSDLYWFGTRRVPGGIDLVPHRIDNDSGVGTQLPVGDVDGDGLVDVVIANKKGAFYFHHESRLVDRATWWAAQPQRR